MFSLPLLEVPFYLLLLQTQNLGLTFFKRWVSTTSAPELESTWNICCGHMWSVVVALTWVLLTPLLQVQPCMDSCGWLPALTARRGQGCSQQGLATEDWASLGLGSAPCKPSACVSFLSPGAHTPRNRRLISFSVLEIQ